MAGIELWRSEPMQLVQLIIPTDAAHDTMYALGELGLLQFRDMNSEKTAFQRTYANQVKRCEEMARKLRFFEDQVQKAGVLTETATSDEAGITFDDLDSRLEMLEKDLMEVNTNNERLQKSHSELVEMQLVLQRAGSFFDDARRRAEMGSFVQRHQESGGSGDISSPLLESQPAESGKNIRLGFVTGIIEQEKMHSFERLLFRVTRGNMFLRTVEVGQVVDPQTGESKNKSVFVVFFAGDRARLKINKICETFGANRYPFPESVEKQQQMMTEVNGRVTELQSTLDAGERHRMSLLEDTAHSLPAWMEMVKKEKGVFHNLNKLSIDVTRQALVAEAWAPVGARERVQQALESATNTASASVKTIFQSLSTFDQPPTYFETHMFNGGFQAIVDAYGVARYREVNPATWTIITFPFLFAVMFGDYGHAVLMLVTALALIGFEKKLLGQKLNDMFEMLFSGRYVILLMGLFSIYTGLLYNELYSMPSDFFGTQYYCKDGEQIDPRNSSSCPSASDSAIGLQMKHEGKPYLFGVDPVWHGYETNTELTFTNSIKMKMSIIMGVVQMTLGIIMSLNNQLYFKDYLSVWCEFIPQIIFLWSVFGYMCFLIIFKWVAWPLLEARSAAATITSIGRPPDLYHIMIYFFLQPGSINCGEVKCSTTYNKDTDPRNITIPTGKMCVSCPENDIFDGQGDLQLILLLAAFVAIPWMLLIKPLILRARNNKKMAQGYDQLHPEQADILGLDEETGEPYVKSGAGESGDAGHGHGHGEEFQFGEVMVHQMIHTIEFVLGCVSNTASYLRLWALSLAHSQLSAVFYSKVLMQASTAALGSSNKATPVIFMYIGYFVWACATIGVLMIMESLSAFLHALRLHWVEFQNKFYHGDGYQFTPFSFETVLLEEI
eukprot:TRINITY_DN3645_c0_g5_i1.p1 TRINITY_DN3645_c0_g5~~TRINITY_DN3645_c0_g5_i1.p1  ORF type:complete len:928 (-),score=114.24 TRINITY_DN3645_c0_g5_i1:286-2970(-)